MRGLVGTKRAYGHCSVLACCHPRCAATHRKAAAQVQALLGAKRAVAFDLTAACSGFVLALVTGAQYIKTGTARNVLVIGADALSRYVDWRDRCEPFRGWAGIGSGMHRVLLVGLCRQLPHLQVPAPLHSASVKTSACKSLVLSHCVLSPFCEDTDAGMRR